MTTGSRAPDVVVAGDELVHAVPRRAADRDAEFSTFAVEHGPALVRTAWLLCGDRARAEDLAQQALLRTYLAWARLTDPAAYARRVVATARIDTWRRHRREVLTDPAELRAGMGAAPVRDARPAHDAAADNAERDLLLRALLTLTARQRRVVVLRYLLDLPEAEVAADLGVSVGTVKSTASRGLAQLRTALAGMDGPATHAAGGRL